MPSSPIVNTPARPPMRIPHPARRTYATERPHLPQGANKPLLIAALLGIPALAYLIIPSRDSKTKQQQQQQQTSSSSTTTTPASAVARAPNLDPAAAKRRQRDENDGRGASPGYEHPEHRNPEEMKPAFGQLHPAKRVDGPPDGRNHQALHDRGKVI